MTPEEEAMRKAWADFEAWLARGCDFERILAEIAADKDIAVGHCGSYGG